MCVWKYTDEGADFLNNVGPCVPLWCVRVDHDAWPKITSGLLAMLDSYFVTMKDVEGMPSNLKELQEYGMRLNIIRFQSGGRSISNPENAPLQEYSVVCWIAGDIEMLKNFFTMLDGFIDYRSQHRHTSDRFPFPSQGELNVTIHPCDGVEIDDLDVQKFTIQTSVNKCQKILPQSVFSFWPPWGNRFYKSQIEVLDESTVIVGFEGKTYDIRRRFEDMDYDRPDGNLRVLKSEYRDVSQPGNVQHILDTYGDAVLKGSVCAVEIVNEEAATAESDVAELLKQIKALPNVHLATF